MNNTNISTKLYPIRIYRLEQNRIKVKEEKIKCIKAQDYETAGKLRDEERDIIFMIDRLNKLMKLNEMITNK